MTDYQVLARKYRPRFFKEVIGQEAIVTTLKNAIRRGCVAHAYLFCGSRGTGKTTVARLFAKALNCSSLSSDFEPCDRCPSCLDIASGHAMDVLEIDGASHRGIEEIRKINETVGYAPSNGKYKIYLIDEVHMLTKEAFNALLKTIEEPPEKAKFFFATTEFHKIPTTIVSRCQRFHLHRLSLEEIQNKLSSISQELGVKISQEALYVISQMADGGLRDAESFLDQLIAFEDREITAETVRNLLGLLPRDLFFALDYASKKREFSTLFKVVEQIFSSGINAMHFIEEMTMHFRTFLLLKSGVKTPLPPGWEQSYQEAHTLYSEHQCMDILEILGDAAQTVRFAPSQRIALEILLMRIFRTHQKISLESLIDRLVELEHAALTATTSLPEKISYEGNALPISRQDSEKKQAVEIPSSNNKKRVDIQEDPSPKPQDFPFAQPTKIIAKEKKIEAKESILSSEEAVHQQSRFDTLMRFAAKELDGSLKKE